MSVDHDPREPKQVNYHRSGVTHHDPNYSVVCEVLTLFSSLISKTLQVLLEWTARQPFHLCLHGVKHRFEVLQQVQQLPTTLNHLSFPWGPAVYYLVAMVQGLYLDMLKENQP